MPTAATLAARRKWERDFISATLTALLQLLQHPHPFSASIPSAQNAKKKKNVLRPASRCGYLSSGSQVNEPIKISNFFFYEKYRLCVSKIRLTSLADRKRREAAVPCGFVADVEHAHTKTSRSHTHTQTLRLENIDLQSFVSTNEHYASFFKVHNQPAT